jgi:PilZ domain
MRNTGFPIAFEGLWITPMLWEGVVLQLQIPRGERRLAARVDVKLTLRVRFPKSAEPEQWAESLNVSPRGIYFATDLPLQKGSAVHMRFEMPEEVSKKPVSEWRCTGHVVHLRPNRSSQGAICVGVAFDCYEILPLTQAAADKAQNIPGS